MNRLVRAVGVTLALALSILASPSSAAIVRYCYCEVYCSNGVELYGQTQSRYECGQLFQQYCAGSGTWTCPFQ